LAAVGDAPFAVASSMGPATFDPIKVNPEGVPVVLPHDTLLEAYTL
jgi:hypothetical protein